MTRADNTSAKGYTPLRVAYLVSRFPKTTETFVVRELNEVSKNPEISTSLYSLFPPLRHAATVHPSADQWIERVNRPTVGRALRSFARWTCVRPVRILTTMAMVCWAFGPHPRKFLASLAAMVLGCGLADEMLAEGIEHVHAHFVGHPATAAWVVRRLANIPYSVTAHAYELYQDDEFLQQRVRCASFVATISQYNADFLFVRCGGAIPPISIVRAGIDLDSFPFQDRTVPTSGPVRVLAVGSLIEHKGHSMLIDALTGTRGDSESRADLTRLQVTIVGDGPLRADLARKVVSHGLGDRVRLVGAKTEDEVSRLMRDSDLFILPSRVAQTGRMEGIPVVLMEAMASGLPVIASELSGIPELVVDGLTGTLTSPGDVVGLRNAISAVLDDPERAKRMAATARKRVEDDYDVRNSALKLSERFLSLRATAQALRTRRRRPAFIAWSQSARSRELAAATGGSFSVVYFSRFGRRALAPLRYLMSVAPSVWFLLRERPSVVVATNPPIFPALLAYLLRPLTRSELVLDSHPRGFGYKHSAVGKAMAPIHRFLVRRARATLVAGPPLADLVEKWGGRPMIVHEASPAWTIDKPPALDDGHPPVVLWVTVFASDEPVATVLETARQLPDVEFLVPGDLRRCPPGLVEGAPRNVVFTGFWADEGYARLIAQADVMLVLTTEPTSVPRAAFEAVEGLRPLVLTDLPELRRLFSDAIHVENTSDAIASGIRTAIQRHADLVARVGLVRLEQRNRWLEQNKNLIETLNGS